MLSSPGIPRILLAVGCAPRGSTLVWGERGTTRDLLSPCQPRPSMIADLLTDGEDLADDFPCSEKREQMSGHPFSPAHLRDVSAVLITLLSCSTRATKPPRRLWWPEPEGQNHAK